MAVKLFLITFCITVIVQKGNSGMLESAPGFNKCSAMCDEKYSSAHFGRQYYCVKGCKLYGLSELVVNKQPDPSLNKETCHNFCFQSSMGKDDKAVCIIACNAMAKNRIEELKLSAPMISMSITVEEGNSKQNGEMLEPDDALTDPGFRKQLLLAFVDEMKLPEMKVKTLPVVNMDKNEFEAENQDNLCNDCTVRKVAGGPNCIAASFVLLVVIFALWLLLSCEEKSLLASSPTNYDSEQAPPLPIKYSLLDNEKV